MPRLLLFLFILLPAYWIYLLLNTRPIMIYDAINYDGLGRVIMNQGMDAYFHSLNREPLFPYLVSRAMILAKTFGLGYHYYLKGILYVFLALTLIGIYRFARLLGAGRGVAGAGALYAGISPALLNSVLWLWSEAAALPLGIWGVYFSIRAWKAAMDFRGLGRVFFLSSLSAGCFVLLLFVKAAAGAIVMLYMGPFLLAGIFFLLFRGSGRSAALLMIVFIILGSVHATSEWVKLANLRGNGNYALTSRVDYALYGNTVRRLEPLTPERISQAVLSVPRLGFCERVYGSACVFWSFPTSDRISFDAIADCNARGLSAEQRRSFFMKNSFSLMKQHPVQQGLLSALEGAKMLFWENRVYFVRYPDWMVRLYSTNALVYTLCFGWAFLSLAALCFAFTRRSAEFLLAAVFILVFIAAYSLFFIDIRYALPIAPLFIALTAGMAGRILRV